MPRFHVCLPLHADAQVALPPGAARHVQVLRLQPGQAITLFDGAGGQWSARITRMGRQQVHAQVLAHQAIEREAARPVHLAASLMAAERMDWLVEKATELGAASLTPLLTSRSSLRLSGERASKKRAHWQAVAAAACEQSGRNRLPDIGPVQPWADFLAAAAPTAAWAAAATPHALAAAQASGTPPVARWVLSLDPQAAPLSARLRDLPAQAPVHLLSGPEGGLSPDEEAAARAAGWQPVTLGPRVLRAETAPLAALACLTLG